MDIKFDDRLTIKQIIVALEVMLEMANENETTEDFKKACYDLADKMAETLKKEKENVPDPDH